MTVELEKRSVSDLQSAASTEVTQVSETTPTTHNQSIAEAYCNYVESHMYKFLASPTTIRKGVQYSVEHIESNFLKYIEFIKSSPAEQDIHERLTNLNRAFGDTKYRALFKEVRKNALKLTSQEKERLGFTIKPNLVKDNPEEWELKRKLQALKRNLNLIEASLVWQEFSLSYPKVRRPLVSEHIEKALKLVKDRIDNEYKRIWEIDSFQDAMERIETSLISQAASIGEDGDYFKEVVEIVLELSNITSDSYKGKEWWLNHSTFKLILQDENKEPLSCEECNTKVQKSRPYEPYDHFYSEYGTPKISVAAIRKTNLMSLTDRLNSFSKSDLSDPQTLARLEQRLKLLELKAHKKPVTISLPFKILTNTHICLDALAHARRFWFNPELSEFLTNTEINELSAESELYLELRDYRSSEELDMVKGTKERQLKALKAIKPEKILEQMSEFDFYIDQSEEQVTYVTNVLKLFTKVYMKASQDEELDNLFYVKDACLEEFEKLRAYTPDMALIHGKKASIAFEQMSPRRVMKTLHNNNEAILDNRERIDSVITSLIQGSISF